LQKTDIPIPFKSSFFGRIRQNICIIQWLCYVDFSFPGSEFLNAKHRARTFLAKLEMRRLKPVLNTRCFSVLVKDILKSSKTAVSFEFFPPKTEAGWEELFYNISSLVPQQPSYVSVTYGAGGATRTHTHELVTRLQRETNLTVVAHLTCVGSTRKEILEILENYASSGVENILALRGDPPQDKADRDAMARGEFEHAHDLVAFIKENFPSMGVGVAGFCEGHPGTQNRLKEIDYLKQKVDAGADYIVTQLFFDNRDFYDFCERCSLVGIDVPVIAGIMPITSEKNLARMAELAAGARFPAPLLQSIGWAEGKEYVRNVGIHWATEQIRDLLHNDVAGIHLYTLNNSYASLQICESLGLRSYTRISSNKKLGVKA
jgi:methylenetetrahydrofolate reductase (NADPH)